MMAENTSTFIQLTASIVSALRQQQFGVVSRVTGADRTGTHGAHTRRKRASRERNPEARNSRREIN